MSDVEDTPSGLPPEVSRENTESWEAAAQQTTERYASVFRALAALDAGASDEEIARILGITKQEFEAAAVRLRQIVTKAKKSTSDLCDALETVDKRLCRQECRYVVRQRVLDVFEDEAMADDWLVTPNRALDGRVPKDLLDDEVGRKRVSDLLGRIKHGDFR